MKIGHSFRFVYFFFLKIWIPWFFTSANSWLYSSRVSLSCLFSISRSETLWAFFWICRAYSNTGTGSERGDKKLFFICPHWSKVGLCNPPNLPPQTNNYCNSEFYNYKIHVPVSQGIWYGQTSNDNSSDIKNKLRAWTVIKKELKVRN